ncbi:MAG: NYN domain-containing protein [Clostridia bacterium]|nr:NYN domain-containing protein [Clostridia bacterium]
MGILRRLGLLRRKKPTVSVFVDFEHWCYSLDNLFNIRPDVAGFYALVAKEYTVKNVYFFGDFTSPGLRAEVDKIRAVTNNIIDTQNSSQRVKKDFTDFIMLDYIYRDVAERKSASTYIIFSGDGHFSSVAAYLKNKRKKKVVVYGVEKSTSNRLKSIADECILIPGVEAEKNACKRLILASIDYNMSKKGKGGYTTYGKTVNIVAYKNELDRDYVSAMMKELTDDGIIYKKVTVIDKTQKITTIDVNWDAAIKNGLWEKK